MPSFFSGIDDKYELGDPGIHLVVGSIDVNKNVYTIAASVVGNGRRFLLKYDELIDATPISEVTFHPDVLKYVDYSTPTTVIKYSPVIKYKGGKSHRDSDSYDKWLEQYANYKYNDYDGYNQYMDDPFFFNENGTLNTENVEGNKTIKLWEIEDLINDYINQNSEDLNKILHLYDVLTSAAKEIDESAFATS